MLGLMHMKFGKILITTGFVLVVFAVPFLVYGAETPQRYFVKSTSPLWKNALNARNSFDNGFSADLAEWQIKFAKLFNVETEPIAKLYILPSETEKTDAIKKAPTKPTLKGQRALPSSQIPWGVSSVYRNSPISSTLGGEKVIVAVIDTGVDKDHPDLKRRIVSCKDFTHKKFALVDGRCDDQNGHGTHVAGIISADGGEDKLGVYGIAPQSNISAFKICDASGVCYADDVAAGIRNAADESNIINLSIGSDNPSQIVTDAINYAVSKGVLVVAAAGNDGPYFGSIDYPAFYKDVIGVGAFGQSMLMAEWSSRGSNSQSEKYVSEDGDIEFAMPGVNIESTWKGGKYAVLSGTSMAAPHLAGLAAKYWQADKENPAYSTREILRSFSLDINELGDDDASGWGFPRVSL